MDIQRINAYDDPRFSREALLQHGCYLVDGVPCEVRIVSTDTAVVTGCPDGALLPLTDAFRFNAKQITSFTDAQEHVLRQLPPAELFNIRLCDIQPSQFFVDEDKLAAVRSFVHEPEDIIVPVAEHQGRYISLDGHTRLYLAEQMGWAQVRAIPDQADDVLLAFAAEAIRRGVRTPADMTLIPHGAYEEKWNRFCDAFMRSLEEP